MHGIHVFQEAYAFCKKEAARQLQDIHSAFLDILEFGSRTDHVSPISCKHILVVA
jgi:hypothetical protein